MRAKLGELVKSTAFGGVLLVAAAVLAMLAANSPFSETYEAALHAPFAGKTIHHWINDGLMVIFFLLVGMEIKRECIEGHLATRSQAMLPIIAACGGVVLPAIIYLGINAGSPDTQAGWAIASATDIAFAVGILALFGKRLPLSLKVFLTAVAVIDDLMAILIIALFYSKGLATTYLAIAAAIFALLLVLNRAGIRSLPVYLLIGIGLWLAVLQSGIHATIAGVLLGIAIPLPTLKSFEHKLAPYVAYGILPIFAFANSGIPIEGMSLDVLTDPVPLGIMLGLFFGKQLGIFGAAFTLIKLGYAHMPEGATWKQLYGVCIVGGIGFTMSLFIGLLAFPGEHLQIETRIGVMLGSILSGLFGYFFLRAALAKRAS